jgi:hypothetical protein
MNDPTQLSIYQLRAVLNGVSPLVWHRFLLSGETSLADLHKTYSCPRSGFYLYKFRIHGKTFNSNAEDPRSVCLGDFQLRPAERFRYRYNFPVFWESDLCRATMTDPSVASLSATVQNLSRPLFSGPQPSGATFRVGGRAPQPEGARV